MDMSSHRPEIFAELDVSSHRPEIFAKLDVSSHRPEILRCTGQRIFSDVTSPTKTKMEVKLKVVPPPSSHMSMSLWTHYKLELILLILEHE